MVNLKRQKFKVNSGILRKFRRVLNKSQIEIVKQMTLDGCKIGLRKYKEAEQGKRMTLEIISTIARWYNKQNLALNSSLSQNNISPETISDFDTWDEGIVVDDVPIHEILKTNKSFEHIPLHVADNFNKFLTLIKNSSKRKIMYKITPTSEQNNIINEFLKLIDELKKSDLTQDKLDDDDNYGSNIPSTYLQFSEQFKNLLINLKKVNLGFYLAQYQKPILNVEPVDPSKLDYPSPYSTADWYDGNVPDDYVPVAYGSFKTKLEYESYAFYVFDEPNKYSLEIKYTNRFHKTNLKKLLEEDNFTSTGVSADCRSNMVKYYGKKYDYLPNIPNSTLEFNQDRSYSGQSYDDWYSNMQETADDVLELLLNDSRLKNYVQLYFKDDSKKYNFEIRQGREKWFDDHVAKNPAENLWEDIMKLCYRYEKIPKIVNLILTGGDKLDKAIEEATPTNPLDYD